MYPLTIKEDLSLGYFYLRFPFYLFAFEELSATGHRLLLLNLLIVLKCWTETVILIIFFIYVSINMIQTVILIIFF